MHWKRPETVPVGRVWGRFQGRERNGVPGHMYQIRDMLEEDRKACLDMMQVSFLRDEPLSRVLNIKSDPASVTSIRSNWEMMTSQGISIACYTEVDGQPKDLVGFNILIVKCVDDEKDEFEHEQGEPWKKLLKTLIVAESLVDVFKHYSVHTFMSSSGLTVLPEHRGQNIGARMIEVREQMCKAFNIQVVSTVFTAKSSQVLAKKCGYEVLATLPYSDMLEHGIDLSQCETPTAEIMGICYK